MSMEPRLLKRAIADAIEVRLAFHPPPHMVEKGLACKVRHRGQYGIEVQVTAPAGVIRRTFVISVREEYGRGKTK